MNTLNFTVTGMTCEHCERSVREEVSELTGVQSLEVSAAAGTLSVTADLGAANASDFAATIIAAVDEAGYAATFTA